MPEFLAPMNLPVTVFPGLNTSLVSVSPSLHLSVTVCTSTVPSSTTCMRILLCRLSSQLCPPSSWTHRLQSVRCSPMLRKQAWTAQMSSGAVLTSLVNGRRNVNVGDCHLRLHFLLPFSVGCAAFPQTRVHTLISLFQLLQFSKQCQLCFFVCF